jgi:transposase
MVYQFMREHKNYYSIREMAKIFGVSSSACYRWAKRCFIPTGGRGIAQKVFATL